MRVGILGAICLLLHGLAGLTFAREIKVEPSPSGEPVLARAITAADDGDTICVSKGVYRETIALSKSVQLVGEEGAILDPSQPFAGPWQPVPELGPGVYRAPVERKPRSLLLDGKLVAEIDERRAQTEGSWFWKKLLVEGTPRSGFRFIRAVWMHRATDKAIYLHLADGAAPAALAWSVIWTSDPIVTLRGAKGASLRGLTLAHGYVGVVLRDQTSRCTVADCRIGPWDKQGVLLTGGAAECLIESNRIFRGAYEDWTPVDTSRERYEVWQLHKLAGFYDRVGIDLVRAGANNRVHANHVWETFDGIDIGDSQVESLDIPLASADHGRGTEVWDNVIERTRDSGIELGVGCVDVRVHHNTLRQTHGGLRFKLPRLGPVFIYRNLLIDGMPFNIWYSMDDSPAEGYVYHNTIVGGDCGLLASQFKHRIGTPRWHYFNNLVVARTGFFRAGRDLPLANFIADFNLAVGGGKPWPEDATKDRHSLYVNDALLTKDYRPQPHSHAIDAGLDLSTAYHGKPLPGCEPGYFKGRAPDIGAFEVR
jgi:hypothetical protein